MNHCIAAVAMAHLTALAPAHSAQTQGVRDSVVAFVGANVLTMRSPDVARDQTVLVRGNVIAAVGPAATTVIPTGARRIDARGKYLMPGLADFHVHVAERNDLSAYLKYGVTTIAQMGGFGSEMLEWREAVRARRLDGPRIYVGYFMNGPLAVGGGRTISTTTEARDSVADTARRGFDFIKVYNSLTAGQFEAIIAEAKARRLPVLGHAVRAVGLERGFAMGQVAVAHGEEYIYADLQRRRDTTLIPWVVGFTKKHDATMIANLSAFAAITRQWGNPAVLDSFFAQPEASLLTDYWRGRWQRSDYVTRQGGIDALPFIMKLTLGMQRGGVRVLLGTDSPSIPGVYAGASLHDELRLLVEAGLTPYEALAAGTRSAGEFAMQHLKADPVGIVATGYRADLLLLGGNPLENLANARVPLLVMAAGRLVVGDDLSRR